MNRLVLVLVAVALLAACGKKGDPVPPPGETNVYPRFYPTYPGAPGTDTDKSKNPAPSTNGDRTPPAAPSPSP